MTLDQFDEFASLCAEHLHEHFPEEFCGSPRDTFHILIKTVKDSMFKEQIEKEARYQQFLKLKQEFEPKIDASLFNPHTGTRK